MSQDTLMIAVADADESVEILDHEPVWTHERILLTTDIDDRLATYVLTPDVVLAAARSGDDLITVTLRRVS